MTSQSVTNKLVANIKQASNISTNFFTGTNVVCIDTSNRRIGIDTKTPTWSIDISGDSSYNGVKCHNLDISGTADISYALIKFLKAPTISADNVNISFVYINELSGNLIDISEIIFNSISGDFIYSNNTISGNFIQCFSAVILNNLDIKGSLTARRFDFDDDVSFNNLNIDSSFTTQIGSESKFIGKVEFLNNTIPVQYRTLSGEHINTVSLSCENLQVNQKADFSSITVLGEASFNTINVSGDAVFSTISADSMTISGQTLTNFITQTATSNFNFGTDICLNKIYAKQLYIESNIDNTFVPPPPPDNFNYIDKLIINNSLDLSYNTSGTSLILPYKVLAQSKREIGHIYYSKDAFGVIDGIEIIKNNGPFDTVTLKQSSTTSYMLKFDGNVFESFGNFQCVPMTTHKNIQTTTDSVTNAQTPQFADISNISRTNNATIIEINANIIVSLNNDNNGKDVDALNYDFYIFGLNVKTDIDITSKKLVSNKNTILVFDNSYNYSSTSLHYIGKKKEMDNPTFDINYIVFGISYENVPGKDLSLNLVNFNASIKTIN
mgnify:CR=1 FL=1